MMTKSIQYLNPRPLAKPNGFSHLTTLDSIAFISGQVAYDENGTIVGEGDLTKQTRQVLTNLQHALAEVGSDFSHVLKMNFYVRDISEAAVAQIREVRKDFLIESALPASTMVGVAGLAKETLLLEVEVYALIP